MSTIHNKEPLYPTLGADPPVVCPGYGLDRLRFSGA